MVVRGNSAASVSFMVTPKKIGRIEIRASASTTSVQDSVTEHLLVVAEGETQYYTKTILIDLRKQQRQSANVTIEIPKNIVSGSESIDVSVVGDLLGPAILNLESLVRLPSGCGEQNLVHFMPDLIVLNYLERTSRLVGKRNEAIDNLETSYQQQLTYRRPDGSFSAFGKSDGNGSIW